jgi:hypothetical protein
MLTIPLFVENKRHITKSWKIYCVLCKDKVGKKGGNLS